MTGTHNFTLSTGNSFKIALYTSSATLSAATTNYTATGEVNVGSVNYTATGNVLTNVTPNYSGTTAYTSFANSTWSTSTITARGALIYNDTNSDAAVVVLDFGSDKISAAGDFTVVFPVVDSATAIIRIT